MFLLSGQVLALPISYAPMTAVLGKKFANTNCFKFKNNFRSSHKPLFYSQKQCFSSNQSFHGPISGAIAYWATKSLCYGTAVAAASTAVVATGGLAGAATGALVAGATASAGTGATVVAGAITSAGLASDAAMVTMGATAAAGGILEVVAAVEGASACAATFFTLIPFLP